jgi:PadR family transcriptional regulator PadR
MSRETLEMLKGTLDVVILRTLSWGPMHGYDISRVIRQRTGEAFRVEEGALYPALRRMEKKEWLRAQWGTTDTGREAKFYELTRSGRQRLQEQLANWERYVTTMARVLDPKEARP